MLRVAAGLRIFLHRRVYALAVLAGVIAWSCGNGESEPTPTPSPPIPIQTIVATLTPTPPAPETTYRFVYREFGPTEDRIWRVDPSRPGEPELVAAIPHLEGYGISASLSPDGEFLAYITAHETAPDPRFQSTLHIMDLVTGETETMTGAVDITFQPLWSPDGQLLYVRRNEEQRVMLLKAEVERPLRPGEVPTPVPTPFPWETPRPPEATPTPTPDPVTIIMDETVSRTLSFIPVGFDDEHGMLFVEIMGGTGGGTMLGRYSDATYEALLMITQEEIERALEEWERQQEEEELRRQHEELFGTPDPEAPTPEPTPEPPPTPTPTPRAKLVATLSEQIAFDYGLSPDSRYFSFVAQELIEGQFLSRAFVTEIETGQTRPLPDEGLPPVDHVHPVWHPDGLRLAVGLLPYEGEPGAVALVPVGGGEPTFLLPPPEGFDEPLAWSPDGSFLAVRNFTGDSLANPGTTRVHFVAPTGQRIDVASGVDAVVLGWFPTQPAEPAE